MRHPKDLSDILGKTFGVLTVLREDSQRLRGKRTVYCRCKCGVFKLVAVNDMRRRRPVGSCGCMRTRAIQRAMIVHQDVYFANMEDRIFGEHEHAGQYYG